MKLKKTVTGIRLVSAVRNKALDLTIAMKDQADDATYGQPVDTQIETVVNGFTLDTPDAKFINNETANNDAYTVYKIDLKEWFKWKEDTEEWDPTAFIEEQGEDGAQLLGNVKGWHNALDASNSTNVTVADGSVFAGKFVIPFDNNKKVEAKKNTFELQLIGENDEVLKAWDVKLDPQSRGEYDADKVYSIYRNHLYQVGKRGSGDTPTDPGKDPDKPQPLDKDQELIIKINDQWEFIHNMEIE